MMRKHSDRGDLLRELRGRQGYTLRYAAEAVQVSEAHLSEVELGKREPSVPLIAKLLNLYEVKTKEATEIYVAFGRYPPDVQDYLDRNPQAVIRLIREIRKMQRD